MRRTGRAKYVSLFKLEIKSHFKFVFTFSNGKYSVEVFRSWDYSVLFVLAFFRTNICFLHHLIISDCMFYFYGSDIQYSLLPFDQYNITISMNTMYMYITKLPYNTFTTVIFFKKIYYDKH